MTETEKEIYRLFQTLDETQRKAAITTATAMISGAGTLQALLAGNIILAANGYDPVPLSAISGVVQSDCEEDDHGTCS